MDRLPQSPGSPSFVPVTPRTDAFNKLEGKKPNKDLPLRHHISMGDEIYRASD